jgi:transcriptional regulator with XRE-family HTH domain
MENDVVKSLATNLRRLRAEQGRSLSDLARTSGVAKATLSALEGATGNPTLDTLQALSTALGVPFGDLLVSEGPEPVVVVRADEGTYVPGTSTDLRLIVRLPGPHPVELYEATFPPRATRSSGAHGPGTREHVLVLRGTLRTGPADRPVALRAGDLAGFAADEVHVYEAGARGARALLVMQWPAGA